MNAKLFVVRHCKDGKKVLHQKDSSLLVNPDKDMAEVRSKMQSPGPLYYPEGLVPFGEIWCYYF